MERWLSIFILFCSLSSMAQPVDRQLCLSLHGFERNECIQALIDLNPPQDSQTLIKYSASLENTGYAHPLDDQEVTLQLISSYLKTHGFDSQIISIIQKQPASFQLGILQQSVPFLSAKDSIQLISQVKPQWIKDSLAQTLMDINKVQQRADLEVLSQITSSKITNIIIEQYVTRNVQQLQRQDIESLATLLRDFGALHHHDDGATRERLLKISQNSKSSAKSNLAQIIP